MPILRGSGLLREAPTEGGKRAAAASSPSLCIGLADAASSSPMPSLRARSFSGWALIPPNHARHADAVVNPRRCKATGGSDRNRPGRMAMSRSGDTVDGAFDDRRAERPARGAARRNHGTYRGRRPWLPFRTIMTAFDGLFGHMCLRSGLPDGRILTILCCCVNAPADRRAARHRPGRPVRRGCAAAARRAGWRGSACRGWEPLRGCAPGRR